MKPALLEAEGLRFTHPKGGQPCLDIEALNVDAAETVFLHGPSWCGKTTLLSLFAGVLVPDAGRVTLLGQDWTSLTMQARDRFRVDHVGYIFQQFNLLPYLGALDNVLLPCRFSPRRRSRAIVDSGSLAAAGERWLADMGLDRSIWQREASTLSVGQQQRVAAARALIGRPDLVIADEPTSALDEDRRERFLDLLLSACHASDSALVLVSHDRRMASRFSREVSLPAINRAEPRTAAEESAG